MNRSVGKVLRHKKHHDGDAKIKPFLDEKIKCLEEKRRVFVVFPSKDCITIMLICGICVVLWLNLCAHTMWSGAEGALGARGKSSIDRSGMGKYSTKHLGSSSLASPLGRKSGSLFINESSEERNESRLNCGSG